jgi:hypothetical protein
MPLTSKQIYALAQANWRRHVNGKAHDFSGKPGDLCPVCRAHSRVLRQELVNAFSGE